ncbi:39S ribosomal protein L43, mitochondrial [Pseudolycoriella hygida]|uniref:Large ribosomal subunit protein mL43 n=1 Tax=Pseudolycoriella hygida TaxID=35572 RepID=A0A9Q0RZF9_9DIPT|nr:39S ribosomal protein L43, mitochondrial [Pseudolycoriella hygida]
MSNSSLFLPSTFPRAPIQNGLGRYLNQLQRITFKFCKSHGSSKGMRDFIENDLIEFAKANAGVVVYVKPRRHRAPVMVAEYLNGERHWMSCRGQSNEEIKKWVDLMRGQNANSSSVRLRKMWHTDKPSIQGPWTPFTHKNPELNFAVFPDQKLSQPMDVGQTATEKLMEIFKQQKISDQSLDSKQAE